MISVGSDFDKRYLLLEEIGRGGMSFVFRAKDKFMDREVALKVINPAVETSSKEQERFKRECQTLSGLSHPNIVKLLSSGIDESGRLYLVMELLAGRTLESVFLAKEKIDNERFASIFLPVIEALIIAHEERIIHRDLKPANIMLVKQEDGLEIPKILDFGIAKILFDEAEDKSADSTVGILGSPLYMSPEQAMGAACDHRSDIYSLACVMYQALTGRPPFEGETPLETMYEHLRKSIPSMNQISRNMRVSQELVDLISRSLSKNPEERPATMREFKEVLSVALRSGNLSNRAKRPLVLLSVLSVMLVSFFAFALKSMHDSSVAETEKLVSTQRKSKVAGIGAKSDLAKADQLFDAGDKHAALAAYRSALKSIPPDDKKKLSDVLFRVTGILKEERNYAQAIAEYKTLIAMYPDPIDTPAVGAIGDYLDCLFLSGKTELCDREFGRFFKEFKQRLGGDHSLSLARLYEFHSDYKRRQGLFVESVKSGELALKEFDAVGGRTQPYAVDTAFIMYDCLMILGDARRACAVLSKTKRCLESAPYYSSPVLDRTYRTHLSQTFTGATNPSGATRGFALGAEQRGDYELALEMLELSNKQALGLPLSGSSKFLADSKLNIERIKRLKEANPKSERHLLAP